MFYLAMNDIGIEISISSTMLKRPEKNSQNVWECYILRYWLHTCQFHLSNIHFLSSSNCTQIFTVVNCPSPIIAGGKAKAHSVYSEQTVQNSQTPRLPRHPGCFLSKASVSESYFMTYIPLGWLELRFFSWKQQKLVQATFEVKREQLKGKEMKSYHEQIGLIKDRVYAEEQQKAWFKRLDGARLLRTFEDNHTGSIV